MSRILLVIALSFCLFQVRANIWDNLFFEEPMNLAFPSNFYMKSHSNLDFGSIEMVVRSSQELKKMYFSQKINLAGLDSDMSMFLPGDIKLEMYVDFNINQSAVHTPVQKCKLYSLPNETGDYLPHINGALKIASLTADRKTDGDYIVVDPTSLIPESTEYGQQQVLLYYSKEQILQKVEFYDDEDNVAATLFIDELKPMQFTEDDFFIPKNWKCEKADTVVIDKIDPQDILDKIENGGFDSDNIDLDALLDALPIGDLPKSIRNQIKKELEKAINNGVDGFDDFGGNEGGSGKHGGRGGRH